MQDVLVTFAKGALAQSLGTVFTHGWVCPPQLPSSIEQPVANQIEHHLITNCTCLQMTCTSEFLVRVRNQDTPPSLPDKQSMAQKPENHEPPTHPSCKNRIDNTVRPPPSPSRPPGQCIHTQRNCSFRHSKSHGCALEFRKEQLVRVRASATHPLETSQSRPSRSLEVVTRKPFPQN